jgi:isopenicillin N synthase-like dioxygenase
VKLKAWITRTGAATQDIELFAQRSGYPPSHISLTTGTADFTGIITIYADVQNSTASASDITLKEFKVELHNVI